MTVERFRAALHQLTELLATPAPLPEEVGPALQELSAARPAEIEASELRQIFALCYQVMGLGPTPVPKSLLQHGRFPLHGWAAQSLLMSIFTDEGVRHRDFVQSTLTRSLALGQSVPEGAPTAPVPVPHIPLSTEEAAELAQPYLARVAAQRSEDPNAHVIFAWSVKECPVRPFDGVVNAWLRGLDPEGHAALDRAFALATLAKERRQKLTWQNCVDQLLPQLSDPSVIVAACAARYLGTLYSDPSKGFVRSRPAPLEDVLDQIASLEPHRRAVAGGVLQGLAPDFDGPFDVLKRRVAESGYDIDDWVLRVLDGAPNEPSFSGAQAFWFYVHEAYCMAPDFILRMIEAGHHWEAMMCATEVHAPVEGIEPVLRRLAALPDPEVSAGAKEWLSLHYSA